MINQSNSKNDVNKYANCRSFLRVPIATVVDIKSYSHQETAKVVVREIAIGGMGCTSEHPYKKGDLLLIKLEFVTSDNEVIQAYMPGVVAWSIELDIGGWSFGVEFRELERTQPKLYDYIKSLENTRVQPRINTL